MDLADRLFDGQTVDVPCPECRHIEQLTVPQLRSDPTFQCGGCGKQVQIDSSQFREQLLDVERELEKLRDTIRGLGGDLE